MSDPEDVRHALQLGGIPRGRLHRRARNIGARGQHEDRQRRREARRLTPAWAAVKRSRREIGPQLGKLCESALHELQRERELRIFAVAIVVRSDVDVVVGIGSVILDAPADVDEPK